MDGLVRGRLRHNGLSYYPYWHVDVDKVEEEITDLEKCFPDKKIWIVEFNWPYGWEADGQNALYEKFTEKDIELKYGVTKTNREVYFKSSEIFPSNNCNQYDWFVEKKFLGDVKFTLVVDLDKDCYSARLLPFVPHPNAKTTDVSLSTGFFDSYEAASGILGATTPEFKGAAVNGPVKYMKYNVATASVDVQASNSSTIQQSGYSVGYELYRNREMSTVYSGNPGVIYFNLQGIEMRGELTPGVIRQQGTSATKVVVR